MNSTSPEIQELKKEVETHVKRKIRTPNDFSYLSEVIWEGTHMTLSPTTLKRIWGYIEGDKKPRESTLDIVSSFIGYDDWDDFKKKLSRKSGSRTVLTEHIAVSDLNPDDRIFVSWLPDRKCIFKYLGDSRFIVEKSVNSKLQVGSTFSVTLFLINEPLYLNNLVQGSNSPVTFVIGCDGGINELRFADKKDLL